MGKAKVFVEFFMLSIKTKPQYLSYLIDISNMLNWRSSTFHNSWLLDFDLVLEEFQLHSG